MVQEVHQVYYEVPQPKKLIFEWNKKKQKMQPEMNNPMAYNGYMYAKIIPVYQYIRSILQFVFGLSEEFGLRSVVSQKIFWPKSATTSTSIVARFFSRFFLCDTGLSNNRLVPLPTSNHLMG